MKEMKKRAGAFLLILVLLLTQIYLPGTNIQVRANTVDVENVREEVSVSEETLKEEEKEADKKETKVSDGDKTGTDAENETAREDTMTDTAVIVTTDPVTETDSYGSKEEGSDSSKGTESEKDTVKEENKESCEEKKSGESTGSGGDTEQGEDGEQEGNTDSGEEPEDGNEDRPEEPAYECYRVTFRVTGEDDVLLENAVVTLQRSENGDNFDIQQAVSEKVYDLNAKLGSSFLTYKFNVTADGYTTGEGTFSFDPTIENDFFSVDSVEQDFTITVHMNVDENLYRVEIRAVDENRNAIVDPVVNMNWSVDIYGSYQQPAIDPGVYELRKKRDNGDPLYYIFSVAKEGYTTHEGSKFTFQSNWWNPYFDVKADKHFLTITVCLTSLETALNNAKDNAVQQLQNYTRLDDYRKEEQQEITKLISTWTMKINNASNVSSVSWNLEQAKKKLDALKTKVEYEDEEYRSRIYFQTNGGQKIYADQYGVVTITNIDSGNFYITRPDGSLYANDEWDAKWRCVYEYKDQDHPESIGYQVIVGTYGQYAGKYVGKYDATVTLSDLGRAVHFTVRIIDGRVDKLRAIVDGKDVSGGTIKVMGSEKKTAVIEGRMKGTERWVSIPGHALKYTSGGSTSVMPATAQFRTWGNSGSITYTLDADRSVSVTVYIQATIIKPTEVKVICPSKATVGDWNGAFNQYVGIMEGQGGYRVEVTPSNASNPGVTWEDLTPDVATFQSKHALGIVPKKAGTAKFRVTCNDNPKVSTTVTILFQYEKPLKTAEAEKSVYYAKTSDKTIDLKIITNGKEDSASGASEQRFYWSYSISGVAKVSDAVHYDKTSVTIPNWFSHTISILGAGSVYVTGTPYDTTENCKPVTFKVVVTDSEDLDKAEAERVENLILAIGKVTLEKKGQIQNARSEFRALTSTQKGLVDDEIYNILVKAELELRRLERAQAGGNSGDGEEETGGDTPPVQDGSGDLPQDGENTGDSGNTGEEAPGTTDGTDTGETDTIGDTADSVEENESAENKTDNVQKKKETHKTVTAADNGEQQTETEKPDVPEESDTNGSGKKFFEVDIHGIQEEIQQIVDEISPVTKAVVAVGTITAFVFGVFWRRRQYLRDKKNNSR